MTIYEYLTDNNIQITGPYGFDDSKKNQFWFEKTPEGTIELSKDCYRTRFVRDFNPDFKTKQQYEGWHRANLYMGETGWDDGMTMGALMASVMGAYIGEFDGKESALLFTSPQCADKGFYKLLTKEQVRECRSNVTAFYKSRKAQLSTYGEMILLPICVLAQKGVKGYTPVSVKELYKTGIKITMHGLEPVGTDGIDWKFMKVCAEKI